RVRHLRAYLRVLENWTDRTKLTRAWLADNLDRQIVDRVVKRMAADAANVAVWASGPDKHCIYVNKRWLQFAGRTFQQELGEAWTDAIHPQDRSRSLKAYHKAFDARKPLILKIRMRAADGTYRWCADYGVPAYDPDTREFRGYVGCCIMVEDAVVSI